jgi:hypothetical protein
MAHAATIATIAAGEFGSPDIFPGFFLSSSASVTIQCIGSTPNNLEPSLPTRVG